MVAALRTLTVLPVPGKDTANFSNSLFWFPVVGGSVVLSPGWYYFVIGNDNDGTGGGEADFQDFFTYSRAYALASVTAATAAGLPATVTPPATSVSIGDTKILYPMFILTA